MARSQIFHTGYSTTTSRLACMLHPSSLIREKYPKDLSEERVEGLVVTRGEHRSITRRGGWISVLAESMQVWLNKCTSSGWIFFIQKSHPFYCGFHYEYCALQQSREHSWGCDARQPPHLEHREGYIGEQYIMFPF